MTAQPSVPVGNYTQLMLQATTNTGMCGPNFSDQVNANTVSQESDVRQVVAKVQLGEADAGVSYLTDVTPSVKDQVTEVMIPDEVNQLATYPIATAKGHNMAGGEAFMNYVMSPIGQDVLAHWGFLPAQWPPAD